MNCDCKSAAVFRRKKLVAQSTVWTWTFYLYFIALKDKSAMIKLKTVSRQKHLHYADDKTSALCKHLHTPHANAKLAMNPE